MVDAILQDRPPAIPGEEGKKAVELILAIYESSKTNKPVKLPL
jgi:predicted dehydrogenase